MASPSVVEASAAPIVPPKTRIIGAARSSEVMEAPSIVAMTTRAPSAMTMPAMVAGSIRNVLPRARAEALAPSTTPNRRVPLDDAGTAAGASKCIECASAMTRARYSAISSMTSSTVSVTMNVVPSTRTTVVSGCSWIRSTRSGLTAKVVPFRRVNRIIVSPIRGTGKRTPSVESFPAVTADNRHPAPDSSGAVWPHYGCDSGARGGRPTPPRPDDGTGTGGAGPRPPSPTA